MTELDRRRFLQIAGGTAAFTMLNESIARATAIAAQGSTGTIQDIEHIVVLMQENRSFDHYFGSLKGVRGFGDPRPVLQDNGRSVFHQSNGTKDVLPFNPQVADLGMQFLEGLDHDWAGGHQAYNNGKYDRWVPAKTATTMSYMTRNDIPFHYALADAFTVCDAYHCSFIGATDPNRYYLWSGHTGNDGTGGGPVLGNQEAGYSWKTYPERLESAGISWKVYQDVGDGLNAAGSWGWINDAFRGNYGDNSLLYFNSYRNAQPGSALYEKARTGTDVKAGGTYFDKLRADVTGGTLPKISWIAAPEAFSEHSNWPTNFGAWYISQVLDALTANPAVWAKTALFLTYDENDGFFDHVVPPYPPASSAWGLSTADVSKDLYPGGGNYAAGPYGLGPRVPMVVVSPWSKGGYVCSETFDHTSVIRFLEQRFGVDEPNITPWRRAITGDLTSAFDFSRARTAVPALPSTTAWKPADDDRHPDYKPVPPAQGSMPRQERGTRPARPVGYDLDVVERAVPGRVAVTFVNRGNLGAHVQARLVAPAGDPHSYTVGAGDRLDASWPAPAEYDVHLHGPNGFFRRLRGSATDTVRVRVEPRGGRRIGIVVDAPRGQDVVVRDGYAGVLPLRRGRAVLDTRDAAGWYDLSVTTNGGSWLRAFAGHVEDGKPSRSEPALGT